MRTMNRGLLLLVVLLLLWCRHSVAAVDFQSYLIEEAGSAIQQLAVGDVDHDGDQDLIGALGDFYMGEEGTIVWWENFGLPEVMIKHAITLDPWVNEHMKKATSVQATDLNQDGQIEIISANRFVGAYEVPYDELAVWWKNAQNNYFGHTQVDSFPNTVDSSGYVLVADMDQDGDQDIEYLRIERQLPEWLGWGFDIRVIVYENQNGGTAFASQMIYSGYSSDLSLSWDANPRMMAAGDLDQDGDIDLLLAFDYFLIWLRNDGAMQFTPTSLDVGMFPSLSCGVFMQDIDQDGDMDICLANHENTVWFSNDGTQQFTSRGFGSDVGGAADVLFTDVKHDSDLDVILIRSNTQGLAWLENDGSQNYLKHNMDSYFYSFYYGTGALLDVDADGNYEVISATRQDDLKVWVQFQPTPTPTASASPTVTPTRTPTPTTTASSTPTPTPTLSPIYSPTVTPTITLTGTISPTPTITGTSTPTPTITQTAIPNNIYLDESISRKTNWQDGVYTWISYPGGGYWYQVYDYGTDVTTTWQDEMTGLPYDDPVSVITCTSDEGWGKLLSPAIQCDVDYYPFIEVSVVGISPAPHATWKIGIQEMEGAFRYWDLNVSSMDTGTFVFNYRDLTGLSGQARFVIQLTIEGAAGRWFKVDYVRVYHGGPVFSPTPTETPTATTTPTRTFTITPTPNPYDVFHEGFTGADGTPVAEWEDEEENSAFNANLKYANDGFYGCLTRTAESNWGKALSPHIRCNVNDYPMLEVRVVDILPHTPWWDPGTRWKLGIQELEGAYRYWDITNSMKSTGVFRINYALLTDLGGISEFAVQLTVEGDSAAAVQFDYVRVYSENPPTFTPTATVTVTATRSPTITETSTITPTPTESLTFTTTPTSTATPTTTLTATITETFTASPTFTDTETCSPTLTESPTSMPTATATPTSSASPTSTPTPSPSLTATFVPTRTGTATATVMPGWELEAGRVVAYPNPARGSVNFGYYAGGEVQAVIDIYRLTGERVATITDRQNGGSGRALATQWRAADVAAGVYFYRLVLRDADGRETMVKKGKIALIR